MKSVGKQHSRNIINMMSTHQIAIKLQQKANSLNLPLEDLKKKIIGNKKQPVHTKVCFHGHTCIPKRKSLKLNKKSN